MINRRRLIKLSAAAALAPRLASPAVAQGAWPNKAVRIIIPFTPGGGADTIARFVALKMTEVLGQQFIVESKPGAGGNIAAEFTARSAPDGYTMFLAGDHHATNTFLNPNLTYHPVNDFEPVSLVVQYPVAMAVPTTRQTRRWRISSPAPKRTRQAYIRIARPRRCAASFGRAVRARCQHQDDPRALPRRCSRHSGSDSRDESIPSSTTSRRWCRCRARARCGCWPSPRRSAPRWRPTCRPWVRRCLAMT